ncbi:MAG: cytochrome c maturation protein CcmE [Legionellales bacterium]|nr:MAG: cytochrome c maturation protein CcmE [Legionellales bacterium]
MRSVRKKRLYLVLTLLASCVTIVLLVIYALSKNINFYYTPSEIISGKVAIGQRCRLGGMVVPGSIKHFNSLTMQFTITDFTNKIFITYTGVLPDLFRAGQGVVVQGALTKGNSFLATQVLAKHDENYMPPL